MSSSGFRFYIPLFGETKPLSPMILLRLKRTLKQCKCRSPPMDYGTKDTRTPFIYLNNAATTWPKPPEVLEEVAACLRNPVHEAGRTTGSGSTDYPSVARELLAAFFHADPSENFIFTQNATDALNLLIHGFVKKTGKPFHAVTTALDHNSVLRPLSSQAQDGAISLSVVPFTDNKFSLGAIRTAIRPETRLVGVQPGGN